MILRWNPGLSIILFVYCDCLGENSLQKDCCPVYLSGSRPQSLGQMMVVTVCLVVILIDQLCPDVISCGDK